MLYLQWKNLKNIVTFLLLKRYIVEEERCRMSSLENIYKQHMNDIYVYLLQLSSHRQTAEDLVQDVFLKAYYHLEFYKGESVRPWLFKMAYHTYIDWYRKEKRAVQTDPQLMSTMVSQRTLNPEDRYLVKEKLRNWLAVTMSLPEKQHQVILLRDFYEFTYDEISQILNLSLANVKVLLFRARQTVNEVIKNEL